MSVAAPSSGSPPGSSSAAALNGTTSAPTAAPSPKRRESFSLEMHSSHNGALLVNGGAQGAANGQVGAAQQGLSVAAGPTNGAGSSPSPSPLPPTSSSTPSLPGGPVHKPTFLETKDRRFLIMDAPNDANLHTYFDVLKKRQVVCVTRVCEPCYAVQPLNQHGIQVFDIPFPDGDAPPPHVVDKWLALVDQVFKQGGKDPSGKTNLDLDLSKVAKPAIAIHCVAGLGRAPVMVAIALVESGMEPFDAIAFIRKKRRGAINARQLKYIENYKRRGGQGCCVIQ